MAYEVWDTETSNLIGAYETEDAALAALHHDLGEHDGDYVATLLLGHENNRGRSRLIAMGPDLVDLVRARRSGPPPTAEARRSA